MNLDDLSETFVDNALLLIGYGVSHFPGLRFIQCSFTLEEKMCNLVFVKINEAFQISLKALNASLVLLIMPFNSSTVHLVIVM